MAAERQVIDGERIVELDSALGELEEQLASVRRRIKDLNVEEESLVARLREALGVGPSQRTVPSSVAGTVNGIPVVSASSFTRPSVDGALLRRLYPEIYTQVARQSVVTTVRVHGIDL